MVLLELGDDRSPDVAYCTAEPIQSGARSLLRADLETGQPVVRHPCHSAGEMGGIGDRRPVLPGARQHRAVIMVNQIGVAGPGPGPAPGGKQPPDDRAPA